MSKILHNNKNICQWLNVCLFIISVGKYKILFVQDSEQEEKWDKYNLAGMILWKKIVRYVQWRLILHGNVVNKGHKREKLSKIFKTNSI